MIEDPIVSGPWSSVPLALWHWDSVSDEVLLGGPSLTALTGLAPGPLAGGLRGWLAHLHPDDRRALDDALRQAASPGQTLRQSYRWGPAAQAPVWHELEAQASLGAQGQTCWSGSVRDVSAQQHAHAALVKSERAFRNLTKLSSDWFWQIDERYRFSSFAGYQEQKSGMTQDENMGKTRWDLGALNMDEADWERHRADLDARRPFHNLELLRMDKDGQPYWVSISGSPTYDADGQFTGYQGVGTNVTERKRAEQEADRLAHYDHLTGLPNRRLLNENLAAAQARAEETGRPGAVLFIDLDNFKDLNDSRGHVVGDLLLEQVGVRLRDNTSKTDSVGRFGGDEFIVILRDLPADEGRATETALQVARRLIAVLNEPYRLEGQLHHSTPSIGLSLFWDKGLRGGELMRRADMAMYRAKSSGRNTVCVYDQAMEAEVVERAMMESDLRAGLSRGEMRLVYQPQMDADGVLLGAETLLRWESPHRGTVSPGVFIPLAEQSDLIIKLGTWVLEAACMQLTRWRDDPARAHLSLAVNVSVHQFRQPDFVDKVRAVLRASNAPPARLKLELTESVLLDEADDVVAKMRELKTLGLCFSLDDFGTGYSSLSYLKQLPLDQVKIDQSFVRDLTVDRFDVAIVTAIIALARSLDLVVVAEGVEQRAQFELLKGLGCDMFQGDWFGRPDAANRLPVQGSSQPIG